MKALDQLHLAEEDLRVVEVVARMLRQRFPVERLVLFGSKARGGDEEESDIDLLVLVGGKADRKLKDEMLDAIYPTELEHNKWFGLLIVSNEEWENGIYQAMPIRHEIDREGIEL